MSNKIKVERANSSIFENKISCLLDTFTALMTLKYKYKRDVNVKFACWRHRMEIQKIKTIFISEQVRVAKVPAFFLRLKQDFVFF